MLHIRAMKIGIHILLFHKLKYGLYIEVMFLSVEMLMVLFIPLKSDLLIVISHSFKIKSAFLVVFILEVPVSNAVC